MLRSTSQTYPLTTIDLCNLCHLPVVERYRFLRDWPRPRSWVSYKPTKNNWAKLIAREPTLALDLQADDKSALLAQIVSECRFGEVDRKANLGVSEAVWDWAVENDARSVSHLFPTYRGALSVDRFFEDGIVMVGSKGYGLLLDPRRTASALNSGGRSFAFSAMYWRIAGLAEYVDVDIAILRITDSKKKRRAVLIESEEDPVFSKEQVQQRIEETQRIWLDVQLERRDAASKGVGG